MVPVAVFSYPVQLVDAGGPSADEGGMRYLFMGWRPTSSLCGRKEGGLIGDEPSSASPEPPSLNRRGGGKPEARDRQDWPICLDSNVDTNNDSSSEGGVEFEVSSAPRTLA